MVGFRSWKNMVVVAAVLALTACAASPIKVAQTVEQKAYAAYGTYVITQEHAADLTSPKSTVSQPVKVAIIQAAQRTQPVIDSMLKGFEQYKTARADFEAQKIDQPTLSVAVNNLDSWVTKAASVLGDLIVAVKGATP